MASVKKYAYQGPASPGDLCHHCKTRQAGSVVETSEEGIGVTEKLCGICLDTFYPAEVSELVAAGEKAARLSAEYAPAVDSHNEPQRPARQFESRSQQKRVALQQGFSANRSTRPAAQGMEKRYAPGGKTRPLSS